MTHPLDRPVWNSLSTLQSNLACGDDRARRFQTDINVFLAARDTRGEALGAMAGLVSLGEIVVTIEAEVSDSPPGLVAVQQERAVQMVYDEASVPVEDSTDVLSLGDVDAAHMRFLAKLTKPGPFLDRTHTMGSFWGIRGGQGRLLAMAGERMRLEGYTELSGICVHPKARGLGYARKLSRLVTRRILQRGETPFLHAWEGNEAAIRLYESLGFRLRRKMQVMILARADQDLETLPSIR